MKITDLITLTEFIAEVLSQMPEVAFFLPLSNGEKAVDEISAYYTNDYAGTTAFFQVAEVIRKNNLITFQCSLTIAAKPADTTAQAGLATRNETLLLLMNVLGKLELAAEAAQRAIEDQGDMYDLVVQPVDRIYPIALLANVFLAGHYVDIDITVPAHTLLFPA